MKKLILILKLVEWEAIFWLIGLVYLLFINPYQPQHYTLCPFKNMGITFCPGCGLGRSISMFYHGDLLHSLKMHPLGILAFFLIFARMTKLFIKMYFNFHKTKEVTYG